MYSLLCSCALVYTSGFMVSPPLSDRARNQERTMRQIVTAPSSMCVRTPAHRYRRNRGAKRTFPEQTRWFCEMSCSIEMGSKVFALLKFLRVSVVPISVTVLVLWPHVPKRDGRYEKCREMQPTRMLWNTDATPLCRVFNLHHHHQHGTGN